MLSEYQISTPYPAVLLQGYVVPREESIIKVEVQARNGKPRKPVFKATIGTKEKTAKDDSNKLCTSLQRLKQRSLKVYMDAQVKTARSIAKTY
jgi:hypothetical protein